MISKNIIQRFFNSKGVVFATLTADGVLQKSEKEKDRLIVMDRKAYAVDVALVSKAIEAGAPQLEIKETTLAGSKRVYRISLSVIQRQSRRVTLAGIPRYAFSLSWCELVSGLHERWQIVEHERWLASQSEAPTAREEQPQQQASLFDTQELQDLALSGRWG